MMKFPATLFLTVLLITLSFANGNVQDDTREDDLVKMNSILEEANSVMSAAMQQLSLISSRHQRIASVEGIELDAEKKNIGDRLEEDVNGGESNGNDNSVVVGKIGGGGGGGGGGGVSKYAGMTFIDVVKQEAIDNTILMTFSDILFLKVTVNWVCQNKKRANIENGYVVVGTDQKICPALREALGFDVPCVCGVATCQKADINRERTHAEWHELWSTRSTAVWEVLSAGVNVVHADADAIMLHKPTDLPLYGNPDTAVYSRGNMPRKVIGDFAVVMGFYYMPSCPYSIGLFEKLRKVTDDQIKANKIFASHGIEATWQPWEGVVGGTIGNVEENGESMKVAVMPFSMVMRRCKKKPIDSGSVLVAHCFAKGNEVEKKENTFLSVGLWTTQEECAAWF